MLIRAVAPTKLGVGKTESVDCDVGGRKETRLGIHFGSYGTYTSMS
jgi:hypothetical protein